MHNSIQQALDAYGFDARESQIYQSLLQSGASTAYSIAQRTGQKLPTTYLVLKRLIEKGAAIQIPKSKKKKYAARLPDTLLETLQSRSKVFSHALPELMGMARDRSSGAHMLFFEGEAEIEKALNYKIEDLSNKDIVAFYGAAHNISPQMNDIFMSWNKQLSTQNTNTRAIVPNHPSLKRYRDQDKNHKRIVKKVPYKDYSSEMSVDISVTFVRIITFSDQPQCVIIDSESVAKVFRQIFELLWISLSD